MTISERIEFLKTHRGCVARPEDFSEFWQRLWQDTAPGIVRQEPVHFRNPAAQYMLLNFQASDGACLTARYIRPAGEEKVPTVLMFHDLGRSVRGWHHMTRFVAMGYAVVALCNRTDKTETELSGERLLQCQRDALSTAKAALSLPWTDASRMAAWGEGFGAGLAVTVSALIPGGCRCAVLHTMPTQRSDAPYSSTEHFGPMLSAPLFLGAALMDTVASPEGQFALYNSASCEKACKIYPNYVHERINFFEDETAAFFRFGDMWRR